MSHRRQPRTARRALALLCVGAILPLGLARAQGPAACPGAEDQNAAPASRAASTLCLIGRARATAGLPAVAASVPLGHAAERHAAAMVATDEFSVTGADGSSPGSRAAAEGYRGSAQETIGYGLGASGTPQATVDRWLADPGTRAILLAPGARDAGAGASIAQGGRYGQGVPVYSVVLGTPVAGGLTPSPGKRVVLRVLSGRVTYRVPGGAVTELSGAASIPVGATVDATAGRLDLTAAADRTGGTQHSAFYQGAFIPTQVADSTGLVTVLRLTGALDCRRVRGVQAGAARKANRKRKRKRILWGDGKGRYKTVGSEASATVRGTLWLTEDTCGGTRITVRRGVVRVRPRRGGRAVDVRAGRSILIKKG